MSHVYYLSDIFRTERRSQAIRNFKKLTKDIDYSTIITNSGVSGIGFAAPLAFMLKKDLWVTRKNGDCHSSEDVEYPVLPRNTITKFIYVDDLICTGNTIINSMKKIYKLSEVRNNSIKLECQGVYLYDQPPCFKTMEYLIFTNIEMANAMKGFFE